MKILRFFLGIILSFSLIFIVLVTSIEIAAYSDFSFYEKEYKKYAVTSYVDISMPDLMNVSTFDRNENTLPFNNFTAIMQRILTAISIYRR